MTRRLVRPLAALLFGSTALAPLAAAAHTMVPGAAIDLSNLTLPIARANLGVTTWNPVTDHGAPIDGVTDATAAINDSLIDCGLAGGGLVTLQPYRFVVSSANLIVPTSCELQGTWRGGGISPSSTTYLLSNFSAILLSSGYGIEVGGALGHLAVIRQGMTVPNTLQDVLNGAAAFAGTAITTLSSDDDVKLHDLFIVGFNQCVSYAGRARPWIDNIESDCNADYYFDSVHDVGHLASLHHWDFWPGSLSISHDTETVSAVANNGSGLIRLTIGSTAQLATGNLAYVTSIGGFSGANGPWPITVVDGTHVDLQGSAYAGFTVAGTWASGETKVSVPSLAGVAPGMPISAANSNIAAGTTVRAVDYVNTAIWLSQPTTGAGSGVTLTLTNNAYTSGGQLEVVGWERPGPFISVTNSQEMHFTDTFEWGVKAGYYVGVGTTWAHFTEASCDGQQIDYVCTHWDSTADLAEWNGGEGGGGGVALADTTTGNVINSASGVNIRNGSEDGVNGNAAIVIAGASTTARSLNGLFSTNGAQPPTPGSILAYNGSGSTTISGNMPILDLYPENAATMEGIGLSKGIKFAPGSPYTYADQSSWTPVLTGGTYTYVDHVGRAEIAWPYMTAAFQIALSAASGSGNLLITGLPFSCDTTAEQNLAASSVPYINAFTGITPPVSIIVPDSTPNEIEIQQASSTGPAQLTASALTAASKIVGQFRCHMAFEMR